MFENGIFYKEAYALSKKLGEKIKDSSSNQDHIQSQLINVVDDLLVVWCKEDACLYCQIFQPLNKSEENRKDDEKYKIQTLILTRPPIWQVKRIITNQAASGILLIGDKGLAVVELPKRWGSPPLFEGGKDIVTCKVAYIGEQFLACASKVNVISAAWYPGSLNYSHIITLSSDNYLRIYSSSSFGIPDKVYAVAKGRGISESKFGGDVAMGETAVAFDIGSPNLSNKSLPSVDHHKFIDYFDEAEEIKRRHYNLEWPVFILYSNGDVYYIITSLSPKQSHSNTLYGPLTMLPNSFDNYGLEFCNLIVLQCHPTVLVIGNSKGCMHHCIIMEKAEERQDKSLEDLEELTNSISHLSLVAPSYVLHVYESVHLNLFSEQKEKFPLPPILLTDPITPTRYWLMHEDGIYMVYVPLIEKLIQYADKSGKHLFPERDLECQIEHFLCTQTLTSMKATSIIGLSISYSPSNVFVMLATGAIAILPVPSLYVPYLQGSEVEAIHSSQAKREAFGGYIREILRRSASQPLLISGIDQTLAHQDHLNLLKHVQDTLRKNYILPQIKAKEEVDKRKRILFEQKDHLQKEIADMLNEKQLLADRAHNIAEKYEEANDKHTELMKRLERVLNHFVRDLPTLSSDEREMHSELERLAEKSHSFTSDLSQIKAKHQWHLSQKSKQEINEALHSKRSSNLSENQLACLKVTLGKESEKLGLLAKTVKELKSELGI